MFLDVGTSSCHYLLLAGYLPATVIFPPDFAFVLCICNTATLTHLLLKLWAQVGSSDSTRKFSLLVICYMKELSQCW